MAEGTDVLLTNFRTGQQLTVAGGIATASLTIDKIATSVQNVITSAVQRSGDTMTGQLNVPAPLFILRAGGIEGGELQLQNPSASTNLTGDIVIDSNGDKVRFFVGDGSSNRGAFINLTSVASSANSRILTSADLTPPSRVLLISASVASVSVVNITGFSSYNRLEILLWNFLPATLNDELFCRFSQSGSFLSGAADYAWSFGVNGTRTFDDSDSEIEMLVNQSNVAGNLASFICHILQPNLASFAKTIIFEGGYNASISNIIGVGRLIANNNAIDGIQFGYLGGNITSGLYTVYAET